ncbi:hypothetical protein [uncultured Phascolarctobacterium sp.]|uniref:hypothetical protein n=1 Tax=uncultured Phascolarctobacterium sp. TaxID=512296 RepID=UPI0025E9D191|nr:hypothetical protein [uncultured Phascolarctobacterium sp.]
MLKKNEKVTGTFLLQRCVFIPAHYQGRLHLQTRAADVKACKKYSPHLFLHEVMPEML